MRLLIVLMGLVLVLPLRAHAGGCTNPVDELDEASLIEEYGFGAVFSGTSQGGEDRGLQYVGKPIVVYVDHNGDFIVAFRPDDPLLTLCQITSGQGWPMEAKVSQSFVLRTSDGDAFAFALEGALWCFKTKGVVLWGDNGILSPYIAPPVDPDKVSGVWGSGAQAPAFSFINFARCLRQLLFR